MAEITTISLFAGAGMLDLAVDIAIGGTCTLVRVEREIPAAGILAARVEDGSLAGEAIWSDVRTFNGRSFNGRVDGIIGGFPCTDLSVAGRQAGLDGDASGLFFEYVRIIREVQPRWVFVENVPPVLAFPTGGTVLGELAALGFDAEWGTVRASDVGAPHRRDRAFILAFRPGLAVYAPGAASVPNPSAGGVEQAVLGANGAARAGERHRSDSGFDAMAHAGLQHVELQQRGVWHESPGGIDELAHAPQRGLGELREPSGRGGVADGGDSAVGNAECTRWAEAGSGRAFDAGRELKPGRCDMDHPASPRCGGRKPGEGWQVWDEARRGEPCGRCDAMEGPRCPERRAHDERGERGDGQGEAAGWAGEPGAVCGLADAECLRRDQGQPTQPPGSVSDAQRGSGLPLFPPGPGDAEAWRRILAERPDLAPAVEPELRGLADVAAPRVDRLRAGGNGVVVLQGAYAFRVLAERAALKF